EQVAHNFVVKNVGDEVLELGEVKVTCGCTVAKLEKNSLAPGEETTIAATLNLKGKQGVQSKKITVQSNDPEQPNYYLEFKGTATATIMMEPNLLNLGRIMDNDVHSLIVTLRSAKEGHTFKIEELIASEGAPFTVTSKEIV